MTKVNHTIYYGMELGIPAPAQVKRSGYHLIISSGFHEGEKGLEETMSIKCLGLWHTNPDLRPRNTPQPLYVEKAQSWKNSFVLFFNCVCLRGGSEDFKELVLPFHLMQTEPNLLLLLYASGQLAQEGPAHCPTTTSHLTVEVPGYKCALLHVAFLNIGSEI